MSSTFAAQKSPIKRGINKVKVRMCAEGHDYEAIIYVNGPFKRRVLPWMALNNIYQTLKVAIGEGPYRINAITSCLSMATHEKYPGKAILIYRGLFNSMRTLQRSRSMWKSQFAYRTIESWFPREEGKLEEMLSYHCVWVGDEE